MSILIDIDKAIAESAEIISAIESGRLTQAYADQLAYLRSTLQDRIAWKNKIIRVPKFMREVTSVELRKYMDRKDQSIIKGARMYPQPEALKLLRSWKFMNHSPLRLIEKKWFTRLFMGRREISLWLIDAAVLNATLDELGAHANQFGQYFRCHCPDSCKRKRR